jgi:hypothetical protein
MQEYLLVVNLVKVPTDIARVVIYYFGTTEQWDWALVGLKLLFIVLCKEML